MGSREGREGWWRGRRKSIENCEDSDICVNLCVSIATYVSKLEFSSKINVFYVNFPLGKVRLVLSFTSGIFFKLINLFVCVGS